MAYLSRKEFASKCGVSSSNLTNYIKRKKCVQSGDFFDDSIEPNKSFLAARKMLLETKKKQGKKGELPKREPFKAPPKPIPEPPKGLPFDEDDEDETTPPKREAFDPNDDLASEKMRADILRIKSVEALNQLKIRKQQGELIPTDLVKPLISQLSMSLSSAFKSAGDIMITEISHKKKLSNADAADLRKRLTDVVNVAVKEAVSETKKGTRRLAESFAEARGVGEKA